MQFLVFCAAVLRGVDRWQGCFAPPSRARATTTASARTKRRRRSCSVFLGDQLTDIFEQIEKGAAKSTKQGGTLDVGVSVLPKLPRDAGDRNRTSPFAFTGNKFEFRAVSSGQNIRVPDTVLNAAMADALDGMATELEAATRKGEDLNKAVAKLLTKVVKEHKRIVFNGNNYAPEWEKEAGKRKLLNLKNTVDALPELITPAAVQVLEKYKILKRARDSRALRGVPRELQQDRHVEGQLMVLMANRYIFPAALEYQKRIGQSVTAVSRPADRVRRPRSSWASTRSSSTSSRRTATPLPRRSRTTPRLGGEARQIHAGTRSSPRWRSCGPSATRSRC